MDVEFRENWSGIFDAHPWLNGPEDSYLGFWKRGGGASGEHSHALNLWQFLARAAGLGEISEVNSFVDYYKTEKIDYDRLCLIHLKTENGIIGRVVQDVIYNPIKKVCTIQGSQGNIEWLCHYKNHQIKLLYMKKIIQKKYITLISHVPTILLMN